VCSARSAEETTSHLTAPTRGVAFWLVAQLILRAFNLIELMVIAFADAFFATRHTLVASRQHLTRVLFPDLKGPLRKFWIFSQCVGSFIVVLRMFNLFSL
jgi:hypothetical protein